MQRHRRALVRPIAAALILGLCAAAPSRARNDVNTTSMPTDATAEAAAWARVKDTTFWWELADFARKAGDTIYSEMANDRLALIKPDPDQSVFGPSHATTRTSTLRVKADSECRVAASFHTNRYESELRLWSMPDGHPLTSISLSFPLRSMALAPDYVAIDGPGSIRLFDIKSGTFLRKFDKYGDATMLFSGDGQELLAIPEASFRDEDGNERWIRGNRGRLFDVETGVEFPGPIFAPAPLEASEAPSTCAVDEQETFEDLD
jgi:hypothetical protein